jgi:hypothetical protein
LRVVARNDHPLPAALRAFAPPALRLLGAPAELAPLRPSDDLATRLAGGWEHAFLAGEDNVTTETNRMGAVPPALLLERGNDGPASEPGQSNMTRFSRFAPDLTGADSRVVAIDASDARLSDTAGDGEREPASGDAGQDTLAPATPRAWTSHAATTETASQNPIPLFGNLLPIEGNAGTQHSQEPAVAVRQAVQEIASELRQLQRNGGSELAFTLRLHPEHLGQVEVELQRVDNVWSVSIIAANDEARAALAAEISRLEHRFRESNLTLDGVSVVTKTPEEAITTPTASARSGGADFQGADQQDPTGDQNRDQSGWRNNAPQRILGFDSRSDAGPIQELTDRHNAGSDTGIDIKA